MKSLYLHIYVFFSSLYTDLSLLQCQNRVDLQNDKSVRYYAKERRAYEGEKIREKKMSALLVPLEKQVSDRGL